MNKKVFIGNTLTITAMQHPDLRGRIAAPRHYTCSRHRYTCGGEKKPHPEKQNPNSIREFPDQIKKNTKTLFKKDFYLIHPILISPFFVVAHALPNKPGHKPQRKKENEKYSTPRMY